MTVPIKVVVELLQNFFLEGPEMTMSKLLLRLQAQNIGWEPLTSYKLSLQYVGVYQAAEAWWKMPPKFWEQDPMCLRRQPYFKLKMLHRLGPSVYCKPWSSEMEPCHPLISLFKRVLFLAVVNLNVSWTKISPFFFFFFQMTLEVFLLNAPALVISHLFLTTYLKRSED